MARVFDLALELIVVEAALLVLLASFFFEHGTRAKQVFRRVFIVLAVLAVANFLNYGFGRDGRVVHGHEQYHFFLGSKYLPELRYDAIYEATVVRGVELGWFWYPRTDRRDLNDFKVSRGAVDQVRAAEIRGRFTDERWREFGRDLRALTRIGKIEVALSDHGNTGSPAWAMMASLFTGNLPLNRATASILASLDLMLLAILFWTVSRTYGQRAATLTAIIGMSVPLITIYLLGSILRMDWLVALGLSLCAFEKRHFRTAGILLGYAVASKLLAGVLVIPLGLRFLADAVRERRLKRDHLVYVGFAFLGLALFVGLALLYFRDSLLWQDYYERMLTTFHEHYFRRNHSFRDLFLQALYQPANLWNPMPLSVAARYSGVFISDHRTAFVLAQLGLLARESPSRWDRSPCSSCWSPTATTGRCG
jgi:hypothetical protein